jgi:hypothetical protein
LSHSSPTTSADQSDVLVQRFQALEVKVQNCIQLNHERQREDEQAKQELQANTDDDESDEDESQRKNALEEIETRSRLLDDESEYLQSQLHALKTRQLIGNVDTSEDSVAVVGKPESAVGKMDQRIGDVTTKNRSSAMVGVYKNDFNFASTRGPTHERAGGK